MKKLFILSLLIVASTMVANAQIVTSTTNLVKSIDNAKTLSYDQPPANLISTSIGVPWEVISYTRTVASNKNGNNISAIFNYGGGFNYGEFSDYYNQQMYEYHIVALVATMSVGWRFHQSDTSSLDCIFGGTIGPLMNYSGFDSHLTARANFNINKFVIGLCLIPAMHYGEDWDNPTGSITLGFRF